MSITLTKAFENSGNYIFLYNKTVRDRIVEGAFIAPSKEILDQISTMDTESLKRLIKPAVGAFKKISQEYQKLKDEADKAGKELDLDTQREYSEKMGEIVDSGQNNRVDVSIVADPRANLKDLIDAGLTYADCPRAIHFGEDIAFMQDFLDEQYGVSKTGWVEIPSQAERDKLGKLEF